MPNSKDSTSSTIKLRFGSLSEKNCKITINQSCVIINTTKDSYCVENMALPWEMLEGEYIGYNCTDDLIRQDYSNLSFIERTLDQYNVRKICLFTSEPVTLELMKFIFSRKNKVCVLFDLTCKQSEHSTIQSLVESMGVLKEKGYSVLGTLDADNCSESYIELVITLLLRSEFKELNIHSSKNVIEQNAIESLCSSNQITNITKEQFVQKELVPFTTAKSQIDYARYTRACVPRLISESYVPEDTQKDDIYQKTILRRIAKTWTRPAMSDEQNNGVLNR